MNKFREPAVGFGTGLTVNEPAIEIKDGTEKNRMEEEVISNTDHILKNASELFSRYGIKSVSMDDIAQSLGMSKRTLYEIFGDKEELLVGVILYHRKFMEQLIREIGKETGNILDAILKFYGKMIKHHVCPKFHEDIRKYPKAVKTMQEGREIFFRNSLKVLMKGVEQGVFSEHINLGVIALLLREQLEVEVPPRMFEKYPSEEIIRTVIFTFLRGICTEKGLRICDDFFARQNDESFG